MQVRPAVGGGSEALTQPPARLVHSEEFSGCLAGVFASMFEKNSTKGFTLMNEALKARAEGTTK